MTSFPFNLNNKKIIGKTIVINLAGDIHHIVTTFIAIDWSTVHLTGCGRIVLLLFLFIKLDYVLAYITRMEVHTTFQTCDVCLGKLVWWIKISVIPTYPTIEL